MWIPEITLLEVPQNKGLENKPKLALILMPISDEKCTEKPQEKGRISNYFQLKWPLLRKGIYQIHLVICQSIFPYVFLHQLWRTTWNWLRRMMSPDPKMTNQIMQSICLNYMPPQVLWTFMSNSWERSSSSSNSSSPYACYYKGDLAWLAIMWWRWFQWCSFIQFGSFWWSF